MAASLPSTFSILGFALVLLSGLCQKPTSAEKILFVLPLSTRSETHLFTPLARELLIKGHEVTFVTPVSSHIQSPKFKEIIPIPALTMDDFGTGDPLEERRKAQNRLEWLMSFDFQFIYDGCQTVFKNAEFQNLLQQHFDLLIFNSNFNNCFDGLIHKFKAPFITLSSMPVSGRPAQLTGIRMPPSFVPNAVLEYSDAMTFKQRLINTLITWGFDWLYAVKIGPASTEIYRQHLGQDYPSMQEIESTVSIVFSNSHFSINTPRPVFTDIVEIGGIHCRGAEQLPKELNDWLSAGEDGFILFSLGTVVKEVTLPEETRKMFLNVFSQLKQRVLWKWEGQMEDLPPNVRLEKWLPQQDVLGHKNIKLFISHGGLLSTQESTYHGVPMIGIPFFVDQDVNMLVTQKLGFSLTLEILELTEEKLTNGIYTVLNNATYMNNAKRAAGIFRDRSESPLKTAIYWIEYVLRYNGAPHLRSASRNLTFFQYHSLDVIAFLFVTIVTILVVVSLILVQIVLTCIRKCRKVKTSKDEKVFAKKWQ